MKKKISNHNYLYDTLKTITTTNIKIKNVPDHRSSPFHGSLNFEKKQPLTAMVLKLDNYNLYV